MFQTKTGIHIPGITSTDLLRLRGSITKDLGITTPQIVEAASYSMAMVVRFALGLSAMDGKVACIFDDTLTGWITLATVRHLINAGSSAELIFIGNPDTPTPDLELQIAPLNAMGQSMTIWSNSSENEAVTTVLGTCHNSLCGYFELGRPVKPFEKEINELLNELSTPIYAIECPPGVDPDTGKSQGSPLYASCTLSLGAPLQGLANSDYIGRHYLCDISLTKDLYQTANMDLCPVFAEQPVQQILPVTPPEEA